MIVYLHHKCSTCKNALHFLEKRQVVFSVKDITKTPPSLPELRKMLEWQEGNVKKLFNTSGLLYREMALSERWKDIPGEELLQLLSENGMLIKRPFLLCKDFGLVGFKEADWVQNF